MTRKQVVVDHVAAGEFQRLDQIERRLVAKHAGEHDAAIVAPRPLLGASGGEVIAQHVAMLLDRKHMAGAHDQINFGRRRLPWPLGAEGVDLAHQPAVLVVERDRVAQLVVGDRLAAQRSEIVPQFGEFILRRPRSRRLEG